MGHNYYGEPVWPNDIFVHFPLTMLSILACCVVVHFTYTQRVTSADPFNTIRNFTRWYFFPTFNLITCITNKLLGVLAMAAVPPGLITIP
jgi:cytochrome b6-f complex subunit 4